MIESTFELDENNLALQLGDIFSEYDELIKTAEVLFQIQGARLEKIARDVPYHQATYARHAENAKHIVKWLEVYLGKLEARCTKNYLAGQRALGQREMQALIQGEKDVVEAKQLITEASRIYQNLASIVEAFQQMGWMVGHITKLRVAELHDVII